MNTAALSIVEPLSEKKDLSIQVVPPKRYLRSVSLFGFVILLFFSADFTFAVPLIIFSLFLLSKELRAIFNTRRDFPPIRLLFNRIEFPYPLGAKHYIKARYSEIEAFEVRGSRKFQFVTMQVGGETYNFERQCFPSGIEWNIFVQETITRISETPDGGKQLAKLVKRGLIARSILGNRPKATTILTIILSIFFALEAPAIWNRPEEAFLVLGNSGARILQGEYYRLFTSGFLHLGFLHFGLNTLALISLGFLIEALMGWRALIGIYLLSLLSGSVLSAMQGSSISVGASAAIFGLLGALAALHIRFKGDLPVGVKLSRRWWIFILVANTLLALLSPAIDKFAHLGGFIAGFMVSLLVTKSLSIQNVRIESSKKLHSLSLVLGLTAIFSLLWGGMLVVTPESRETIYISTLQGMIEVESDPERLNQVAWGIATAQKVSLDEMRLADVAINRALQIEFKPEYVDTLATLRVRQGKIDEGIALETELLQSLPRSELKNFVTEQLEKFTKLKNSI